MSRGAVAVVEIGDGVLGGGRGGFKIHVKSLYIFHIKVITEFCGK